MGERNLRLDTVKHETNTFQVLGGRSIREVDIPEGILSSLPLRPPALP